MRRPGIAILLFLLCAGCGNAEQRRQAERDQRNAAMAGELRKFGEAMHDQQNTDATADNATPESSAATEQADADVTTGSKTPANE